MMNNAFYYKKSKVFLAHPMAFYRKPGLIIWLNTLISTFILAMYQPFGYKLQNWSGLIELIGYIAIVSFLSWLYFDFIPRSKRFLAYFNSWTVGKHIFYLVSFLLFTGLFVFYYDFHILCNRTFAEYGSAFFL